VGVGVSVRRGGGVAVVEGAWAGGGCEVSFIMDPRDGTLLD